MTIGEMCITVNTINPSPVTGEQIERVMRNQAEPRDMTYEEVHEQLYEGSLPLGEMVEPEDIADFAVFLAVEGARHLTSQDVSVSSGSAWW